MDEAAFFAEQGERSTAEEIYNALQRRIRSRFDKDGLLLVISSPRSAGDFVERKLAEAKHDKLIYAQRLALWEALPKGRFCGEVFHDAVCGKVPVEFKREFEKDPERARRDLGAVPSRSRTAFFKRPEAIEGIFEDTPSPERAPGVLAEEFCALDLKLRFIHVDLGLKRDGCGIAMAHVESEVEREGEVLPVVRVDLAVKWKARPGEEVRISKVRRLVYELSERGFAVELVTFDQFQSADSRQVLAQRGYKVGLLSVDRTTEAYEALRELVEDGRLKCHEQPELARELRELELVDGRKVDHPPKGSKDLADAVAGAVWSALQSRRRTGVVVY